MFYLSAKHSKNNVASVALLKIGKIRALKRALSRGGYYIKIGIFGLLGVPKMLFFQHSHKNSLKIGHFDGLILPYFGGGYYSKLAKTRASGKLCCEALKLVHSSSNLFYYHTVWVQGVPH